MFGSFGMQEMILLLLLGVLLFGRKLPELARSLGKSVVEFKSGMQGLGEEISNPTTVTRPIEPEAVKPPQRVTAATAPKFDDAPSPNLPPKV